jgi:hypothetical protein
VRQRRPQSLGGGTPPRNKNSSACYPPSATAQVSPVARLTNSAIEKAAERVWMQPYFRRQGVSQMLLDASWRGRADHRRPRRIPPSCCTVRFLRSPPNPAYASSNTATQSCTRKRRSSRRECIHSGDEATSTIEASCWQQSQRSDRQ